MWRLFLWWGNLEMPSQRLGVRRKWSLFGGLCVNAILFCVCLCICMHVVQWANRPKQRTAQQPVISKSGLFCIFQSCCQSGHWRLLQSSQWNLRSGELLFFSSLECNMCKAICWWYCKIKQQTLVVEFTESQCMKICKTAAFNPLSAKPRFQLWYPGGQRLKVISFSWSGVKSPSKCFSNTEPTTIIASRDKKQCNASVQWTRSVHSSSLCLSDQHRKCHGWLLFSAFPALQPDRPAAEHPRPRKQRSAKR